MKSKNQIANEIYGTDFLDLTPIRQGKVTRAHAEQEDDAVEEAMDSIVVKLGRIGNGPTQDFICQEGETVQDMIDRSDYNVSDKETIVEQSSGVAVELDEELVDGAIYVLSPVVKSA